MLHDRRHFPKRHPYTMRMLTDRHGTELEPGQDIRVQECVGRYGQTRVVEGTIEKLYAPSSVTIRLSESCTPFNDEVRGNGINYLQQRKAGEIYTVSVPPNGYHKHDDFEHGHEVWIEVVNPAPEPETKPVTRRRRP